MLNKILALFRKETPAPITKKSVVERCIKQFGPMYLWTQEQYDTCSLLNEHDHSGKNSLNLVL